MPAAKCSVCGKTAYPLESIVAGDLTYHKLTLSTLRVHEGKIYCPKHVPQAKATAVVDTVAMRQATSAPRRTAEGLGTVQKGTGGKPQVSMDTVAMRQATSAPKRTAEGLGTVQKGTGGKPQVVVFGADGAAAPAPQQYEEEQPAEEQPQYEEQQPAEEQPQYEEQPQEYAEEQPAEEQPQYEEQQYEEQPAEEQPAEEGASW